ncbi:hypothetical protein B0H19DRAFT_1202408 [Mycena capillaripes]|nr:hypothetical protein B0H19DRAFT_1202408 [Mycena capillaripes]
MKLAEARIHSYRHMLSDAAEDGLHATWDVLNLVNREDIATTVAYYLDGEDDSSRVFYYREYEDEEGEINPQGIFRSFVFSRTLAAHFIATANAKFPETRFNVEDPKTFPRTAVTLTALAIKRALNYSKTGKLIVPVGKLGEFSKTNWMDHTTIREGGPVHVFTTSAIMSVVNKLSPSKWQKIVDAAIAAIPKASKKKGYALVMGVTPVPDFQLIDHESDWRVLLYA